MPQTTSGAIAERKTRLEKCNSGLYSEISNLAKKIIDSLDSGRAAQACGNRVYQLQKSESLRFLAGYEPQSSVERVAKSILLTSMYRAEQSSPMASYLLCKEISGGFEAKSASKIDRKSLQSALQNVLEDSTTPFIESLQHAGPDATVSVRKSSSKDSVIKVSDSIEIPVEGGAEFGEKIELNSCKLLTVDGIVESVGEINRLLMECVDSGEPLVIYARGWGYEVVSTLLHNWRLGKLKVIPLSCNMDPSSEYYFSDLPTCINCDNSLQGVNTSLKDLKSLSSVTLERGRLSIKDKSASDRARKHVSEIMKDSNSLKVGKWASERARLLSSRKIEFFIGDDAGTDSGIFSDRFNFAIRFYLESRKFGTITVDGAYIPITAIEISKSAAKSLELECSSKTVLVVDN